MEWSGLNGPGWRHVRKTHPDSRAERTGGATLKRTPWYLWSTVVAVAIVGIGLVPVVYRPSARFPKDYTLPHDNFDAHDAANPKRFATVSGAVDCAKP